MTLATYIVHVHVTQKYGLMKLSYLHVHVHFYVSCRAHLLQWCLSFKKYATHKERKCLTATPGRTASMTIVVDKLHFRGNSDKWCQEFCNPYKFDELNEVRFLKHVHLIQCTDKIHSPIGWYQNMRTDITDHFLFFLFYMDIGSLFYLLIQIYLIGLLISHLHFTLYTIQYS